MSLFTRRFLASNADMALGPAEMGSYFAVCLRSRRSNDVELWDSIPGIDQRAVTTVVAEIGAKMGQFSHCATWPAGRFVREIMRARESAARERAKKEASGSGVPFAKRRGPPRTRKNTYLAAQYRHLIAKGKKKSLVVVAYSVLIIAYYLLKHSRTYQDLGSDSIFGMRML